MAQMSQALARLKRDLSDDLPLAACITQFADSHHFVWRDRCLPPLTVVRLFLLQILHGNCAITALRQLSGIAFAASSYCEARSRLPLQLLQSMLQWLAARATAGMHQAPQLGCRILIADGSTYSMEDSPQLHARFNLPQGTQTGVGYPAGKLMGLLDAATGLFVSLLALPLFEHDMRSVVNVHHSLARGDILLGDRAFCSFAHFVLLQARGVFACTRLHQRRKHQTAGVHRWTKPKRVPAWMDGGQYSQLAAFIDVRIVSHTIEQRGYRTRHLFIATTLMDATLFSDQKIAELYGHRWAIETCFDHLKTTMKMSVLRCKTVEGVQKELAVYLVAYNLVRLAMLKAAAQQGVSPWRISFVDAMRWLAARMLGLAGVSRLIVNPLRPGRCELRVIRRRMKPYDLLNKPRHVKAAETAGKQAKLV